MNVFQLIESLYDQKIHILNNGDLHRTKIWKNPDKNDWPTILSALLKIHDSSFRWLYYLDNNVPILFISIGYLHHPDLIKLIRMEEPNLIHIADGYAFYFANSTISITAAPSIKKNLIKLMSAMGQEINFFERSDNLVHLKENLVWNRNDEHPSKIWIDPNKEDWEQIKLLTTDKKKDYFLNSGRFCYIKYEGEEHLIVGIGHLLHRHLRMLGREKGITGLDLATPLDELGYFEFSDNILLIITGMFNDFEFQHMMGKFFKKISHYNVKFLRSNGDIRHLRESNFKKLFLLLEDVVPKHGLIYTSEDSDVPKWERTRIWRNPTHDDYITMKSISKKARFTDYRWMLFAPADFYISLGYIIHDEMEQYIKNIVKKQKFEHSIDEGWFEPDTNIVKIRHDASGEKIREIIKNKIENMTGEKIELTWERSINNE